MKVGLSYDLKTAVPVTQSSAEDALEEYDSLETVEAIGAALEICGHSVVRLGGGREFLSNILQHDVDMVFNIAEGLGTHRGREAQVPAVLEMLDTPYTGSDPACLTLCLDKPLAKTVVARQGVRTPRWQAIADERELHETPWELFSFPAFVKPAHEGSSIGIRSTSRVEDAGCLMEVAGSLLARYRQPVLVEEFIDGDEVTVGLVGNCPPRVMGIMRVLPRTPQQYFIYSLEVKRDWRRLVDYECPAQLDPGLVREIAESSVRAFEALGCRDLARVDFRVGHDGVPYFLEMNPLPGLNPASSDLPIMVSRLGVEYGVLIGDILRSAVERYPQCVPQFS